MNKNNKNNGLLLLPSILVELFARGLRLISLCIISAGLLSATSTAAESTSLQLFYSNDSLWDSAQRESFLAEWQQQHPNVPASWHNIQGADKHLLARLQPEKNGCSLTFDQNAALVALANRRLTPYLLFGLNQQTLERLHTIYQPYQLSVSGIFNSVTPEQQVNLARNSLPKAQALGIFFDQFDSRYRSQFEKAATKYGFDLRVLYNEAHEYPARTLSLFDPMPDALLVTDSVAAYPEKLQGLVLAAYKAGIPLIGTSAAQVQAGALVGLTQPSADYLRQVTELAEAICLQHKPATLQWPQNLKVLINTQVATNLGLSQLTAESLQSRIK